MRVCLLLCLLLAAPVSAQVVDHTSVDGFAVLTPAQFAAATATKVMFTDQSVGWNQWQGLTKCLAVDSTVARNCNRQQSEPQFQVPASEFVWAAHPVPNWIFYGDAGGGIPPALPVTTPCRDGGYWYGSLCDFLQWADVHADEYRIVMWQPSYLHVLNPGIEKAVGGFFHRNQATRSDVADWEAVAVRHPGTRFVLATTSLARTIGTTTSELFNQQVRAYAATTGVPLFDVADIESHDPSGAPCFDGRDGVPYFQGGVLKENFPDDGLALAAICQHYTSEVNGGHLGSPGDGMIRLAKAWWVLVAQLSP